MSKSFDLEKITLEEVKAQLEKGISAQDLLVSVVYMPTYSDNTGKLEPSQDLISKQSELAKLCLAKEAKLKDTFKNIYHIPASFIENNIQLIILSQYDPTDLLQHITLNEKEFNDSLNLIKELIDSYKADVHKLYGLSPTLSSSAIEFLLNRGMKGNALLYGAFINQDKELFKLAFKHGADTSFFKNLYAPIEICNESTFKFLQDDCKVPIQDLLNIVVRAGINQYNEETKQDEPSQELITKQVTLISFLTENGAKLQDILDFPSKFAKNHPSLVKEAKEARYFSLIDFVQKDIEMDPVVLNLMKGIFVKKDYLEDYASKAFLELCYALHKVVDASPIIARVLSYVSKMPDLEIYIDDETIPNYSSGVYHSQNGKIYIKHSITHRVSVIIHECFHKALDTLYKNVARPYSSDDTKTKEQINKLIESDLLVQELVPEYKSWFAMKKHLHYKKEEYNAEVFTFLVEKLTNKILGNTTLETGSGTREFTKEAWEILQKIVATIPVEDGYTPEGAPESLMLSEQESKCIQNAFISNNADKITDINPNLEFSSIDFLLSRGMKAEVLFSAAFDSKDEKKQGELFDLAFKYGPFLKYLYTHTEHCKESTFTLLMDKHKVPVQDLLNLVVRAGIDQYNYTTEKYEPNQELIAKRDSLKSFLIARGAKLEDVPNSSYDVLKTIFKNIKKVMVDDIIKTMLGGVKDHYMPESNTEEKEVGTSHEELLTSHVDDGYIKEVLVTGSWLIDASQ